MKVGKFKKKTVWQARISMTPDEEKLFEQVGREVITPDDYINFGFNHSLKRGLETRKNISRRKK